MKTNDGCGPKVVGLTGGIGAGKSCARRAFALLGVPCSDTDTVARSIHQDPTHPAARAIALTFPNWTTPEGTLHRGSLREFFAHDPIANRALTGILKPHVLQALQQWTALQRVPYVVWESALLLQEDIAVDRLLIVDAAVPLRIARIRSRNLDWSEHHVTSILAMQAQHAHHGLVDADVLINEGSVEQLQEQVTSMHDRYLTLWS